MDYGEAAGIMEKHAANVRGGSGFVASCKPDWKKLENKTWLTRHNTAVNPEQDDEQPAHTYYTLRLFGNEVITYYTDRVVLNDCGFFGRTTHDRLNKYMPKGFSVSGQTIPALGLGGPVGFVRTPVGVFPHNMPMSFSYAGAHASYSPRASEALAALPAYVYELITALFEARLVDDVDDDVVDFFDESQASIAMCNSVLAREYTRALVMWGVDGIINADGVDVMNCVRVLLEYGVKVFGPRDTKDRMAAHMEAVLRFNMEVPRLNAQHLRKVLRRYLLKHIAGGRGIGFATQEWNRR